MVKEEEEVKRLLLLLLLLVGAGIEREEADSLEREREREREAAGRRAIDVPNTDTYSKTLPLGGYTRATDERNPPAKK